MEKRAANLSGGKLSYHRMIGLYLFICVLGLSIIVAVFNRMISAHDKQITYDMCTLITEKMDTSIRYLAGSVDGIAQVITCSDNEDMEDIYSSLKRTAEGSEYISIGIMGLDGTLYATDAERMEFEKWGLSEAALSGTGTVISEPYRSSMTGQLVFTMFSEIYRGGERYGMLFVTYPLDEFRRLANTESLSEETEIWIMDGYSDNMIRCSGTSNFLIGSWSNFKLDKSRLKNLGEYREWEGLLRSGEKSGSVTYKLDNVEYTQVFRRVDYMPGWNVVVRIPRALLSDSMQIFRMGFVAFVVVIIAATLILFVFTHRREQAEKAIFENLSKYDPLTQVLNRRAFESSAQDYFKNPSRGGCALMFFDVDYFKDVNDNYGHEEGDRILVEFSALLKQIYGASGVVSRFGGDEFVVMLRDCSRAEVNEMTDRFTNAVSGVRISGDPDFRLHFSAGMAGFPDDAEDLAALMKCADEALYRVKENGRNGWQWYSPQHDSTAGKR